MCENNQQNFFIVKVYRVMLSSVESYATGDNEKVSPWGMTRERNRFFV